MILGTAAYMSPEQARGQVVDKRTDIWAFGCVLYEMLTGRVAFAGETVSDTIGKILEREPDWSALPAATPAPIRRLLLRCLAKDPKQRLRDIGDVRIEIDAIGEVLPGAAEGAATAPAPATRTRWLPWVALAALAAGVGMWEAGRPATTLENPLANARFTRFTDWEGSEGAAEISPDGKFVAFLADKEGEFDIWLSQVGTGAFSQSHTEYPASEGRRAHVSVFRLFGRRRGNLVHAGDRAVDGADDHAPDRRHATGVPGQGSHRSRLVSGRHAPRVPQERGRRSLVCCGSHGRRRPPDPGATRECTTTIRSGRRTASGSTSRAGWIRPMTMDVWRVRPSGGSPERLTEQRATP